MTATSGSAVNDEYGATSIVTVTPLFGNGTNTNFYVIRHADITSTSNATYMLNVSTSHGPVVIPQAGGKLSLNGRDSKIHVTDYDIGGINLVYSSAEVYTWVKSAQDGRVVVLYGGAEETHEAAFPASLGIPTIIEGSDVTILQLNSTWVLNWRVTSRRRVIKIGRLEIHLLFRNEAYLYWPLELPAPHPIGNYTSASKSAVIIKAGYLLRSASIFGNELRLTGDINSTTDVEVISLPSAGVSAISLNGKRLSTTRSKTGKLLATVNFQSPQIHLPSFLGPTWKFLNSLPELHPSYDDSFWTDLTHSTSNNPLNLSTPTSMYASDYGYHTGSLIYRGHFTASGSESTFFMEVNGGLGFGYSVWVNSTFLGSWAGSGSNQSYFQTFILPSTLQRGTPVVLTVLIDHMGQDEEAHGTDAIKYPRGILNYTLSGHPQSDIKWRMTGNLGGEQYRDLTRGPRNEGAMFAERQGFHLPNPPNAEWESSNPVETGISTAGIGFYTTSFDLNLPKGYDVPLSFVFNRTANRVVGSNNGHNYRCQLFVNGYQFGKYG